MSYYTEITPQDNHPAIGWHSLVTTSTLSVSQDNPLHPKENLLSPDTASYWQPEYSASITALGNTFTGSFISCVQLPSTPNYLGIARHNLGSKSIPYQLAYTTTNGGPLQPLSAPIQPLDDAPILHEFALPEAAFSVVIILHHTNANLPAIAHTKLGTLLRLQRKIFAGHKPAGLVQYAEGITQTSESGQYLGRINTSTWRKTSVSQSNLTQAFVYQLLAPFIAHANNTAKPNGSAQGPYFFCARPQSHPNEVVYGWTHNSIHPSFEQANGMMSVNFDLEGIA